jgi:arylsulfatase A-like enzyme
VRKPRVSIAVVLLAVAAVSAGAVSAPTAASGASKQPNVIVLMTDDQTLESLRVMKNVKRLLAAQGTTFDSSYVSFALCCPSRATFLTGQYAHNHRVLSNTPPFGGYGRLRGRNTLPVWLEEAGYKTVLVGKYLNGYGDRKPREIPPGWTEWYGAVNHSAYRYYGYVMNENGRLVKYGTGPMSYQTDVYGRKAAQVVRRLAPEKAPFFMWVTFLAPHIGGPPTPGRSALTSLPAPRHLGRYATAALPTPASFNELDVSDKPAQVRGRPELTEQKISEITERYQLGLESLLAVDDAVSRIMDALRRSGELENTLIVFTSDNGFLQGEHRIPIGKIWPYEPSARVPLIMRGPGIPAGLHLRQTVANIDLAPTIADYARARAGLTMDGMSLRPLFADPGIFWGRDLLHEGPLNDQLQMKFSVVRTPRWMYSHRIAGGDELYDLQRDPDQLTNLRLDPASAGIREALRSRLEALSTCRGAACRLGPDVSVAVETAGACPEATATVRMAGTDLASVTQAQILLPTEVVALTAEPWQVVRPLGTAPVPLRAHLVFADGRELTKDVVLPACGE